MTYMKRNFCAWHFMLATRVLEMNICCKTNHSYFFVSKINHSIYLWSYPFLALKYILSSIFTWKGWSTKKQNFLFTGTTQNTHTWVVFWTMMQRNSAVLKERKCVFALWWIVVTFVPCAIYCLYSNCRFVVNIFRYRYG